MLQTCSQDLEGDQRFGKRLTSIAAWSVSDIIINSFALKCLLKLRVAISFFFRLYLKRLPGRICGFVSVRVYVYSLIGSNSPDGVCMPEI